MQEMKTYDFTGFTGEKYGKGYILKPSQSYKFNDADKYFYGGWWIPSQYGWFFRNSDYDKFISEIMDKPPITTNTFKKTKKSKKTKKRVFAQKTVQEVEHYLEKVKQPTQKQEQPLSNYRYSPYGKGYLLYVHQDYIGYYEFPSDYKYFHGAWWMDSQNCWFFRKSSLELIKSKGAKESHIPLDFEDEPQHDETHIETHIDTSSEMIEQHAIEQDSDGQDIDSQDNDKNDPDYIPEDDESDDEDEDEDEFEHEKTGFIDLNGMVTYMKYGNGWLVKPRKFCRFEGTKYINGGWWMPKKKGWFFRNEEFKELRLHSSAHE